MNDIKNLYCTSCGLQYVEDGFDFCRKCGAHHSGDMDMRRYVDQLDGEKKPYEILRFTSGLIVLLGWLVILFGLILVSVSYPSTLGLAVVLLGNVAPLSVVRNVANLLTIFGGMIIIVFGITFISFGQIFSVFLDIRKDTHITMRLIRRIALSISKKT